MKATRLFTAPLDDVWIQNSDSNLWSPISVSGVKPTARVYHSAVSHDGAYVTFGGSAVSAGFLNDTWRISPAAGVWEPLSLPVAPAARAGHSAAMLGSDMIVFGGRGAENIFDDTWVLSLPGKGGGQAQWKLMVTPSTPPPRTSHAAAIADVKGPLSAMVLVGGSNVLGKDLVDVWVLLPACGTWVQAQVQVPSSGGPIPRHGHMLHAIPGAAAAGPSSAKFSLIMYGGQSGTSDNDPFLGDTWQLDLALDAPQGVCTSSAPSALRGGGAPALAATGQWSQVQTTAPAPRANMATAIDTASDSVLLFGGFSGYGGGLDDRLLHDSWQLAF